MLRNSWSRAYGNWPRKELRKQIPHRAEVHRDIILVICGVYQAYLAVFDPTVFDLITAGSLSSRLVVSLATVTAAGVPFFFALGALKEGLAPTLETVFFYEKMLRGAGFWIVSSFLTFALIPSVYFRANLGRTETLLEIVMALFVGVYLLLIARQRIQRKSGV